MKIKLFSSMSPSDKAHVTRLKKVVGKRGREGMIEAYEDGNPSKLASYNAKKAATNPRIIIPFTAVGGLLGSSKGVKGALVGAGITAGATSAGMYGSVHHLTKKGVEKNKNSQVMKKEVDLNKVSLGKMTEEEFVKKWGDRKVKNLQDHYANLRKK